MLPNIVFIDATPKWQPQIFSDWGQKAADHLHFDDGFTILAVVDEIAIGFISVFWQPLTEPLTTEIEGYIDIIEVRPDFRRQGIASSLIELAACKATAYGACQLRAWSSEDKTEAIPMWRQLGFGLCPATTYPGGQVVRGYFVTKTLKKTP